MLDAADRYFREGKLDAAEQAAAKILTLNADHHGALHLLGLIRWRKGDIAGAISFVERAIALPGANPVWHSNLAEIYRMAGRLDEALFHGKQGVTLKPESADAWYNLGIIHYERGEVEETIACEWRAIALDPSHAGAHFELAEALLLTGDYRAGWEEYEWRFQVANSPPLIPLPQAAGRQWKGESLKNKTLLVIADQGFGDVIHFMRYLPRIAMECRDLVIACGVEMTALVARIVKQIPKPVRMFQVWNEAPVFDCYMALSSLPRFFGIEVSTIGEDVPYLQAELNREEFWQKKLRGLTSSRHRRIGLVWAGRPEHMNDHNRSLALDEFLPLSNLPNVTLISLQKGPAAAQVGTYYGGAPLLNLGPEIKDFMDTAAIIANLDLVVTVDTAVAHLTGAMGRPAAILLPFAPDWRWLRYRTDSPWYPSVRLYRQTQPKDWSSVIAKLAEELR